MPKHVAYEQHRESNLPIIAEVAYEVNRAYCESIGDTSQLPWDEAPDWQKEGAQKGVVFALDHLDAKTEDAYAAWVADKIAAGWSYGPVENAANKEHPGLVSYDRLRVEQRIKDHLFRAVVRVIAKINHVR